MKQSQLILNYNVSSIYINIYNVAFQFLSNDRLQYIHFISETEKINRS